MQQDFIIYRWAVWPPPECGADREEATRQAILADVPKMLKRRLSPLAKTVFCAIGQCLSDPARVPAVFSSTHGELAKSFTMLERLEAGEDISPTAFSLSVHNAIAGLFSMAWHNKLQCTVVAPGEEGMTPAFIEGLGLLREGARQVLLVYYDEPVVPFYPTEPYKVATENSCALALLIGANGKGLPLRLSSSPGTGDDGEQPWQLPVFIDFLRGSQRQLTFRTPRHSWRWEKNAQTD